MKEAKRLSRKTDPASSAEAAEKLVASGAHASQKQRTLAALAKHPGSTSAELGTIMGVSRHVPARRLPDLERDGLVRRGKMRKCIEHGTTAVTWFANKRKRKKKPKEPVCKEPGCKKLAAIECLLCEGGSFWCAKHAHGHPCTYED